MLVLEDLGPLLSLEQYLTALWHDEPGCPIAAAAAVTTLALRAASARIGEFFAYLHAPDTLRRARAAAAAAATAGCALAANEAAEAVVFDVAVTPVKDRLMQHGDVAGTDADLLFGRVLADFRRKHTLASEDCLILGDLWPGSILLAPETAAATAPSPSPPPPLPLLAVIDWEFSGVGRGANGDMAQFLA